MNCKLEPIDGDLFRCPKCGFTHKNQKIKKTCGVVPVKRTQPPSVGRKVYNFTKAAISHLIKGNPTVSEEVLKERHEICKSCPLFKKSTSNPEWGVCTAESCGCNIKDTKDYLNKIGWADQECPEGKWGKVE